MQNLSVSECEKVVGNQLTVASAPVVQDAAVHVSSPMSQDYSKNDVSVHLSDTEARLIAIIHAINAAIKAKEDPIQYPSEMAKISLNFVKAMANNYSTFSMEFKGIPDVPYASNSTVPVQESKGIPDVPYALKKRRVDEDVETSGLGRFQGLCSEVP